MNTFNALPGKDQRLILKSLDPRAKRVSDLSQSDREFFERYMAAVDRLDLPENLRDFLAEVLVISRRATGKWPRVNNLRARLESQRREYHEAIYDLGPWDDWR